MKRLLLLVAIILLGCSAAAGQNTTVAGNVTGPNGFVWANATGHASLVCPGNAQPYIGSSPIPRDYPTVGLDSNGNFSQGLFDTSVIVDVNQNPMSCNYVYSFTEQCGISSFKTNPLTGVTGPGPVNVTSQINATVVNLSAQCTPNASGFFEQTVSSSATPVFNSTGDTLFNFTLNQNVTMSTFVTSVPAGRGRIFQINPCQPPSGGFSMVWPSNVTLPVNYVFLTTPNSCSPVAFRTIDGGATWQPWMNLNASGSSGGGGTVTTFSAPSGSWPPFLVPSVTNATTTPSLAVAATTQGNGPKMQLSTGTTTTNDCVKYDANGNTVDSGGACSGGPTVGNPGVLQKTDGSGNHVATNLTETSTTLNNGDSTYTTGPSPEVDVNAPPFNARPAPVNLGAPYSPGITTNCTASNTSITLTGGGNTRFLNNDGIDLQQCGATPTMAAPLALVVTPAVAVAPAQSGQYASNPFAGSTTRCYVPVARSLFQGLSAKGPETCITTGSAILGSDPFSITSSCRSASVNCAGGTGSLVTVTTSAHTLPVGCSAGSCGSAHIIGTSDPKNFDGSFPINSVPDTTHFTYIGGLSSTEGATTSSTGGTVTYFNSDHITVPTYTAGQWQIGIYEGASGAETGPVLLSLPNISGISNQPTFYDLDYYGSTYGAAPNVPYFWPSTPPASAVNETLVTTVVSGGGTPNLVVATPPTNNSTTSSVLFDDCPGVQAANAFANNFTGGGGMTAFPPAISQPAVGLAYEFNSYCSLSGTVSQSMNISLRDTMQFTGQWYGNLNPNSLCASVPSFGIEGHCALSVAQASPGIYFAGGSMRGTTVSMGGNSAIAMLHVSAGTSIFENDVFSSGSGLNSVLFYDFAPGVGFGWFFRNTPFLSGITGTPGSTFTPLLISKGNTELNWDNVPMSRVGMYFAPATFGLAMDFKQRQETQSLAMPWLSFYYNGGGNVGGNVNISTSLLDTAAEPLVTNFAQPGALGLVFTINGTNGPSSSVPLVSGSALQALFLSGTNISHSAIGQNVNVHFLGSNGQLNMDHDTIIGPTYGIYTTTAIPPALTCTTVSAGPPFTQTLASSSFYYAGVYPNGGIGALSAPSNACSSNGAQQIQLAIPATLTGATGYVFYNSVGNSQYGVNSTCSVPGTTTITGPSNIAYQNCGVTIPSYVTGGPSGLEQSLLWAPNLTVNGASTVGPKALAVDANGSVTASNRWIAQKDITVGDICQKINHIALTLMPSTGGVIDADGLGSQTCSTNPWAGVSSKGIKFTSVGTQFLTTAQWVLPPSFAWDCGVQGSSTRGCSIVAQAGFLTGTAVLEYATSLGPPVPQSIHVSGLTVDCNNILASIGIEDQFAQEGSYASDVTLNNCASIGLNLIGTGGGAQNSGTWEKINVQTGSSAIASTLCIKMNQVPSSIDVKRWTCNMTTTPTVQPNYGVQIDGGGSLDEGQAQSMAVAGVVIGLNSASTSATKVFDLKMSGSPPPTGVIISNAHNVQHVMLFGIQGAGTNNIIDQQPSTPCNSGNTSALGLYVLDANDSSNNFNRLSGSNVVGCDTHLGFLGLYTASLREASNSYSTNHTLNNTEGSVVATATLTFTAPHATYGVWDVASQSGTTTLTIDGGTLYGNGSTGAFVIPNSQGVRVFCNLSNCYAFGIGSGGGGSGTVNPASQYAATYYSGAGTSSVVSGTNVGITGQTLTSVNASAPTFSSPSLVDSANSPVTSASYPIACDSGTTTVDRAHTILFQSGASTPTVPDSTGTGCAGMVVKLIDDGAGALVFSRSGGDTFIVTNGTTAPAPTTSFTLQNGDFATLSQNASTSWEVTITQNQVLGTPTNLNLSNATALPCTATPALTGDTTTSAGSCATTTAKINGGTFPTSADVVGSDGSAKPIAATPHGASHLLFCLDSSGSSTAQSCTTTPTFSPGAGDMIIYKTTTTNTASLTENVNSSGAATVKKWQGTSNLAAGDMLSGIYVMEIFDGTNWEIMTIGNAPGGATALSALVAATGANTISSGNNGAQLWRWALTSNQVAWALGESSAATTGTLGNQYLGQFKTATGSTAVPLNVTCSINSTATLPCLHITPTWNGTGVNVGAVDVDVTNTASGAGSLAYAARSSGTLKWGVDIAGNETLSGTINGITVPSSAGSATFTQKIASGTSAMGTGAISSGTCATVVTTTATGTATTDVINYTPNTDPTAVTGYAPSASGSLYIWAYPTSGNVNFKVCNPSSGSITPSALTLNWTVTR